MRSAAIRSPVALSFSAGLALAVALAACSGAAGTPSPADPSEAIGAEGAAAEDPAAADPPVRFSLVTDVSRAAPDQEVTVGAVLDIEPGWHVYWEHPGDSGLPTKVDLAGPPSFELGPARFPGPQRFTRRGGFTTFGWEGRVVVSSVARPVAAPSGPLTFTARAEWLACRESCVRGRAEDSLVVDVAPPGTPSAQEHAELWRDHEAALPRPLAELEGAAVRWEVAGDELTLVVTVPGSRAVEWFPRASAAAALIGTAAVPEGDGAVLRVALRAGNVSGEVSGVVAVGEGGARRFYDVAVSPPGTPGAPAGDAR